jgi:hypothetical protein
MPQPTADLRYTNRPIWGCLLMLTLCFTILTALYFTIPYAWKHYYVSQSVKRLDITLLENKQRQRRFLEFYDTDYTDDILEHLRGNPDVEYIAFNLADVSSKGLSIVATLPNLQGLLLYGGGKINNKALKHLQQLPRLERLILRNTEVTDEGLLLLKDFPSLRNLALDDDRYGGPLFTSRALANLHGLSQLKTLDLSCGAFTGGAIEALKKALPECKVQTHVYQSPSTGFDDR